MPGDQIDVGVADADERAIEIVIGPDNARRPEQASVRRTLVAFGNRVTASGHRWESCLGVWSTPAFKRFRDAAGLTSLSGGKHAEKEEHENR